MQAVQLIEWLHAELSYFLMMVKHLFQIWHLIIIFQIERVRISYFSIRSPGDNTHFHIFQRIQDN